MADRDPCHRSPRVLPRPHRGTLTTGGGNLLSPFQSGRLAVAVGETRNGGNRIRRVRDVPDEGRRTSGSFWRRTGSRFEIARKSLGDGSGVLGGRVGVGRRWTGSRSETDRKLLEIEWKSVGDGSEVGRRTPGSPSLSPAFHSETIQNEPLMAPYVKPPDFLLPNLTVFRHFIR